MGNGNVQKEVIVSLPVTEAVAELLRDPDRARAAAALLSVMVRRSDGNVDELMELIRVTKEEAHARGLTDEMIDEELAAYNAERRS